MLREYFFNLANDKISGFLTALVKFALFLLSLVYSFLVGVLSFAYEAKILKRLHLNCKVISIGNITWGGTGKTPVVEMVAQKLFAAKHKVVIQSRGYKKYKTIGDEPIMLQENLKTIPVIVGKDRLNQARLALEKFNPDTIILDDGFQHWKIFRDLDIVVIDAMNPFGSSFLIPRGILREPLSSLKRADVFLLTHADLAGKDLALLKQRLKAINPRAETFESIHSFVGFYNILDRQKNITDGVLLKSRRLGLVTSIGNPVSFEKALLNLGLDISLKFIFLDHHEFSQGDFDRIISSCLKENVSALITTQKDAIRLREYCSGRGAIEVFVLKVEIKIRQNEDAFFSRLFSLYKR
jgi:tetraacyldisaccharide 4'-kinase